MHFINVILCKDSENQISLWPFTFFYVVISKDITRISEIARARAGGSKKDFKDWCFETWFQF